MSSSSKTGAAEGGGKHRRGTPIYKNEFSFAVDGKEHHGFSYATGLGLSPGSAVTVEFVPGKPDVARIQGMRTNIFGPGVLFVVIFPLIGLGVLSAGLVRGINAGRLLTRGVVTTGRLLIKESTRMNVNRRPIYQFTFTFLTSDGQSSTATARGFAERFQETAAEQMVYDPSRPQRELVLKDLPGNLCIGSDGRVLSQRPGQGLLAAASPLATRLGHGGWALRLLFQ